MKFSILFVLLVTHGLSAQTNYTSYFTGNTADVVTQPTGGICMMGGATEDDNAMIWFLQRAIGGDVLVLRASGSDGYNDYLYADLGVPVNSVETIVFSDASASSEPYVQERIRQAEAIWFAGGDQWDYISYWQNTPIDSLINIALDQRNIVIGGTSAGMAILGGHRFTAQNG
ncbi:MAG TPA: Type 1 glutamine amidotransferase-like domain-containing protein, partial [Flavobacteriales bacterium]|nr:Type 1 glutamine amidotransferase-like domain-containing protein [Flavobacteriales bacterium]